MSIPVNDLTGDVYGMLAVISRADDEVYPSGRKERRWLCVCECGNRKIVRGVNLRSGATSSCGCLCRQRVSDAKKSHGQSLEPEHAAWRNLKQRCHNPKCKEYKSYGARGITVCDRWKSSFENFFSDMGPRPKGMSIERKDNNLGYFPENCIWAERKRQQRNTRRTRMVEYQGKLMPMIEVCEIIGISIHTVRNRIHNQGWSAEDAVFTPVRRMKS